jgi:hypothetical protein
MLAARRTYWDGVLRKASLTDGSLWRVISWRKGRGPPKPGPLDIDSQEVTDRAGVADALHRAHFLSGENRRDSPGHLPLVPSPNPIQVFGPTTYDEVRAALVEPPASSPGCDFVRTDDLRAFWPKEYGGSSPAPPLPGLMVRLYNECLSQAWFPSP